MPGRRVEDVRFNAAGNDIAGMLTIPDGEGPFPVAVFVHGSGSAPRDGRGSFIPIFEEFASRGVASLSWDKPGVGESTGSWMAQTFDDRAREVLDAIDYLKSRRDIDASRIGLWGISQAGWVIPKVCAQADDIAFVIAVSVPVGTIAEQDVFRISTTMPADGYTAEETKMAVEAARNARTLVGSGASYAEVTEFYERIKVERWYSFVGGAGDLSPEIFHYAQAAFALDKAPDVTTMTCPVLAVFGEKDRIVDVAESSEHYQRVLAETGNDDVTVVIVPDANHSIMLAETGGQEETARMVESGKWRHADGYLSLIGEWVEARVRTIR